MIYLFPVPCPHAFFGATSWIIIILISREITTRAHGVHIKYGCLLATAIFFSRGAWRHSISDHSLCNWVYLCSLIDLKSSLINIGYTMKPRGLWDLDARGNLYKHRRVKRKGVYGFQGDLNPIGPEGSSATLASASNSNSERLRMKPKCPTLLHR